MVNSFYKNFKKIPYYFLKFFSDKKIVRWDIHMKGKIINRQYREIERNCI